MIKKPTESGNQLLLGKTMYLYYAKQWKMTRIWAGEQTIACADRRNSNILLMAVYLQLSLGTATHPHMVSLESWWTDCQQLVYNCKTNGISSSCPVVIDQRTQFRHQHTSNIYEQNDTTTASYLVSLKFSCNSMKGKPFTRAYIWWWWRRWRWRRRRWFDDDNTMLNKSWVLGGHGA
jgi:hypothetical protein